MPYRLSRQPLEWIDREQTLRFTLEGRSYTSYQGDTVSAALLAQGVTTLGRSFKYHRPRGALSLANHDVNALFDSDMEPQLRGDVTPVTDGLSLTPVNVNGSLTRDRDSIIDRLGRFLPVGFYYRAFHRPRALFPFWERLIRRKAGLGRVDLDWSARRRPKRYAFCDVLVVGGGPAGMQAALSAADAGADVLLVDEQPHLGGSLDYQWVNDPRVEDIRTQLKQDVAAHPRIGVLSSAVAAGVYEDFWVPVSTPEGIVKVRARALVAATGLLEQPAVFRNNDLPGVMLGTGAQRLIHRYAVAPCRRAVVLTANAEGYRAALDLLAVGIEVAAVIDVETPQPSGEMVSALTDRGVPVLGRHAIYEAQGSDQVTAVTVAPVEDGRCDLQHAREIACDGVLMSVGWAPAGHLLYQAGGSFRYDDHLHQLVPHSLPPGVFAAGQVNGAFALSAQLADARDAGAAAADHCRGELAGRSEGHRDRLPHSSPWPIVEHPKGRNFVDFDEDLQLKDLKQAAAEGFDNIELLKRFSTIGMGPSQGKHANMNGIRILARLLGQGIDETGSTTARPFYHSVPMGDLAGRRFRPERLTPLHGLHLEAGAQFMSAGAWLRPEYYGEPGQRDAAIAAEVRAVRQAVGLVDVSTLGKLEIIGPDAGTLVEAAYTMRMRNLAVGMTRYALMVDDSGVIVDDGVAARLADDHYYLSATTSHADTTARELGRCILEWGLDAQVVNRTGQWAAMNIAGPLSRSVLEPFTDIDLDDAAFPYLGVREGKVCGYPVRLLRVGFVGELGYEIHLPAPAAETVWRRLCKAGKPLGLRPFGVEAQRQLRLEKGHVIVSQDTDGLTNPFEAGMSWSVHLKKPYFIGRPSLERLKGDVQRRLVGFRVPQAEGRAIRECHLVIANGEIAGRVTSVGDSETLGCVVGLAMIDAALAEAGDALHIRVDGGADVVAERADTPFYDPDGARQRVAEEQELAHV